MPAMINADLLREQLVTRINHLHREVQQASGFDGLISAGAMLALSEMLKALDAATQQPTPRNRDNNA